MTKTMVSGLLTWLCGLVMLMALLAGIPQGTALQAEDAAAPALTSGTPARDQ